MDSELKKYGPLDSASSPKLTLYSYWKSSCSWRVRFALNLKGLSYLYRAVNLAKGEQFSPDMRLYTADIDEKNGVCVKHIELKHAKYQKETSIFQLWVFDFTEFERLNPLRCIPVLMDGNVVVSDSYAIILYLEEKYPNIPLLPVDPQLRAINLQTASIVSSSIQPLHMLSLLKYVEEKMGPEEALAWAQLHIENGFLALEKLLKDCAGRYATGNCVYMADVFLAPQIAVATTRFKIDMSKFPVLNRIYEACSALPEFQASLPERQPDAVPSSIS